MNRLSGGRSFDGGIAGTYIVDGIGGLESIQNFVGQKLNTKDLALSKEISKEQVQMLLDCMIDHPEYVEKYLGSMISKEFLDNLNSLRSSKTIGEKSKLVTTKIVTIPKERKAEFEERKMKQYQNLPGVKEEYKLMKEYRDSEVNIGKIGRYSEEKMTKLRTAADPETIWKKQLAEYLKKNKNAQIKYEDEYLKKLNLELESATNKTIDADFLLKHYTQEEQSQISKIKSRLDNLFQDHLLPDLTQDLNGMFVRYDGEEFSSNGNQGNQYHVDSTRKFVKESIAGLGNHLKIGVNELPDFLLNMVGELAFCKHYQKELQKQFPGYKISVFKPGIMDDITSGIDAVVQFTPKNEKIEPFFIKIDIKVTNSKKYINDSIKELKEKFDSKHPQYKPARNLSQYLALQNGKLKAEKIITNEHVIIGVHPSTMFFEIAKTLGASELDSKQETYYEYIYKMYDGRMEEGDKIVRNPSDIKTGINKQIKEVFSNIK